MCGSKNYQYIQTTVDFYRLEGVHQIEFIFHLPCGFLLLTKSIKVLSIQLCNAPLLGKYLFSSASPLKCQMPQGVQWGGVIHT